MEKDSFSVKNILLSVEKTDLSKRNENGKTEVKEDSDSINVSKSHKIHKPKPIRPLIGDVSTYVILKFR